MYVSPSSLLSGLKPERKVFRAGGTDCLTEEATARSQ